jgi:hypothetical protein
MRQLSKGIAALALAPLVIAALGCNRGPADAALKSAEQALEAATPELEKYTPGALGPLASDLGQAKALFSQGRYTDSLKSAQVLATQIDKAVAAASERKADLTVAWAELATRVPKLVEALTARLGAGAASGSMDEAGVETAKNALGVITDAWRLATDAYQGGDLPRALATARDVAAKAEGLAKVLGLDARSIAAPGADPVM